MHPKLEFLLCQLLVSLYCTFLCLNHISPSGWPAVSVHPGLQGFVQADVRAVLPRSMAGSGCEGPLWKKHGALGSEERHRLRDQSPSVLQRVPGHGQRVPNGKDNRGRYNVWFFEVMQQIYDVLKSTWNQNWAYLLS